MNANSASTLGMYCQCEVIFRHTFVCADDCPLLYIGYCRSCACCVSRIVLVSNRYLQFEYAV